VLHRRWSGSVRAVAQFGSAPALGAGCRRFKSCQPDQYRVISLGGYSSDATIAWRCSALGVCDGVIGYYGSRIRDYREIVPKCPVLVIFAEQEPSFAPHDLVLTPEQQKNTSMVIFAGEHGFCDRFSSHYNSESFIKAQMLTNTCIEDIKKRN
jgi:dienelactone hydrolase